MEQKETVQAPAEENEDIDELLQNPIVSKILNSRIINYFKKNTGAKIAVITAVLTAGSFMVQLIDYFHTKGMLSVYDISINNVLNNGLFKFFMDAIVAISLGVFFLYTYIILDVLSRRRKKAKKKKTQTKQRGKDFFRNFIMNLELLIGNLIILALLIFWVFICLLPAKNIFASSWLVWVLTIVFMMLVTGILIKFGMWINRIIEKMKKASNMGGQPNAQKDEEEEPPVKRHPMLALLTNNVIFIPVIMAIFFSCLIYLVGIYQVWQIKSYRFVDENYAIVYEDDRHYWLVRAEDEAGRLKLYTPTQKIISVEGVETTRKTFQEVEFIYTDTADEKDNAAG